MRRPKLEEIEEAIKAKKDEKEVALMIVVGHIGLIGQLPRVRLLALLKEKNMRQISDMIWRYVLRFLSLT